MRYGRSASRTLFRLAVAAACLGGEWGLIRLYGWAKEASYDPPSVLGIAWLIGVIVLPCVAFGYAIAGLFYASVGRCPACGAEMSGLPSGDFSAEACGRCHSYVAGAAGELSLVPADHVAPTPEFLTRLPSEPRWPRRSDGSLACCVCGEAGQPFAVAWRTSVSDTRSRSGLRLDERSTDVPHCAQHRDGCALSEIQPGINAVRFRSLAYLTRFCKENGTTVGDALPEPGATSSP